MKRKLIEVAMPLDSLNRAAQNDKNPFLKGHPRSLHLWWSRKPLPVCRAVLFASLVDDPSSCPDQFPSIEEQQIERKRLLSLMESLILWQPADGLSVIENARCEMIKSCGGKLPPVYDPFAGGGSIPLEAKRLGLDAHGADLNPLAVLINKAAIELPEEFTSVSGLAADVRRYGVWMMNEAHARLSHLYQNEESDDKVIAWLYCRSVKCPNCNVDVPLLSKYWLCTKKGRQSWLEPIISDGRIEFRVETGVAENTDNALSIGTRVKREKGEPAKAAFECLSCHEEVRGKYIHQQAESKLLGFMPLAAAVKTKRGRKYVGYSTAQMSQTFRKTAELIGKYRQSNVMSEKKSHGTFGSNAQGRSYGLNTFADYFLPRQLIALCTFTDLVQEARAKIAAETGDIARANALAVYLAFAVNHLVRYSTLLNPWNTTNQNVAQIFGRQAIQMTWDFAEANILDGPLNIVTTTKWVANAIENLPKQANGGKHGVVQSNSANGAAELSNCLIFTDPPYHDYVSYSDLSDFFLVWLERSLGSNYLGLINSELAPKTEELVITPHRFDGDDHKARAHFADGLTKAFTNMAKMTDGDYPLPVFYAFNPKEKKRGDPKQDIDFSGWEIMLESVLSAGWMITAYWTLATERSTRMVARSTKSLPSSLLLILRKRPDDAISVELATLKKQIEEGVEFQFTTDAPILPRAELLQKALLQGTKVLSQYRGVVDRGQTIAPGHTIGIVAALTQKLATSAFP